MAPRKKKSISEPKGSKAPKKTTTKKAAAGNSKVNVTFFSDVPNDVGFGLCDGTQLLNLLELSDALLRMSDDVFFYHVRHDANDFSNWIRDIHKDEKLAGILSLCQSREEMNHYLLRYLLEQMKK
ncbi:hypothetical protein COY28_06200 [Candidatus Woesearchaeota archaeon CG_4_10_14_0_2_um_filter_57_5]|nr:MAG: hypothetical protein AUJ68_06945 [Candidatus Woesearchaeota archaeon CG1_02_57_44]PIZ49537.1 MAG: hypothetical protein COY28_06200 [Candidatus Woesearchaeota archaeon CG_4_10_14_0_2_um_filter_57_5]